MKHKGLYGKRGRPPKNWKPSFSPILQVKRGLFKIIFDEDIEGDLRDLLMGKIILVNFD
tara:strand:- start:911 stop:1087 length:177 start_codon:yes stop_codon:yes gene_type:complete